MKQVLVTLCILFVCAGAFAAEKNINLECSMSSGPGTTQIEILAQGQYSNHFDGTVNTIYSCGAFVDDGNVYIGPETKFVELAGDSCMPVRELAQSYLVYCRP